MISKEDKIATREKLQKEHDKEFKRQQIESQWYEDMHKLGVTIKRQLTSNELGYARDNLDKFHRVYGDENCKDFIEDLQKYEDYSAQLLKLKDNAENKKEPKKPKTSLLVSSKKRETQEKKEGKK